MGKNVTNALSLLRSLTNGRMDPWALAGPSGQAGRVKVLEALHDRKIKRSEAGVNALRAALYAAVGATGNCSAAGQADFERRVSGLGG